MWLMVTRLIPWYDLMPFVVVLVFGSDWNGYVAWIDRMKSKIECQHNSQSNEISINKQFSSICSKCCSAVAVTGTRTTFVGSAVEWIVLKMVMQFDFKFDCYFQIAWQTTKKSQQKERNSTNFYLITKFIRVVLDGRKKCWLMCVCVCTMKNKFVNYMGSVGNVEMERR